MTICESVRGAHHNTRRTVSSGAWLGLTCLCARLACKPGLPQLRNVLEEDVSGKDVERVALYNFVTDDVSPDAILVEKYARRLSSSADQAQIVEPKWIEMDRSVGSHGVRYCTVLYYSISHKTVV